MGTKTRKSGRRSGNVQRDVECADAIEWLRNHDNLDSIVTSIPEMDEMKLKYDEYIKFLRTSAELCLKKTKDDGYVVFLQTDRKHNGWIDKSYFISDEAHKLGFRMMWHKIALRTDVGKTDLYRPTYSHMLCYSKSGKIGKPVPDVVNRGDVNYGNAFGIDAVKLVIEYLKNNGIKKVFDVFVGSGTTLAVANFYGLDAFGVDIDKEMCAKARAFTLPATI
jgi:hypothetical protein